MIIPIGRLIRKIQCQLILALSTPPATTDRSAGGADEAVHADDLGGRAGNDRDDVPRAREQAKAIGVYGFVASAGGSVGLLAGGVLTQAINWHWIFFINVPIGLLTAVAAVRLLDDGAGIGLGKGADLPGAALIVGSLMLGVYTIVSPAAETAGARRRRWLRRRRRWCCSGVRLARGGARHAADAAAHVPLARDRRREHRSRRCSWPACSACSSSARCTCSACCDYDPLKIGLAFLPTTIVMGTLSLRYSERLIMRFGARRTLMPGMLLVAGRAAAVRAHARARQLRERRLPVMLLLGVGVGSSFPALMTLAMAGAHQEDAGLASGLVNTSAQVGGALGLAVLATARRRTASELSAPASRSPWR